MTTLSPAVAEELSRLLRDAHAATRTLSRFLDTACAVCAHPEASHNLTPRGARTSCSVTTGARGNPCGCRGFARLVSRPAESLDVPREAAP